MDVPGSLPDGTKKEKFLQHRAQLLTQAWMLLETKDYRALVTLLEPIPDQELLVEPELGYLLSVAWRRLGREQEALWLLREIDEPCSRHTYPQLSIQRTIMEGGILLRRGDLAEAERCFEEVLEFGLETRNRFYDATANVALGVIADIRGGYATALAYFQRAIPLLDRLGHSREIGVVHHNLGMTYRQLRLYDEASSHFEYASQIQQVAGSIDDIIAVQAERALLVCRQGDYELASALAHQAQTKSLELGSPVVVSETQRVLGIIAFEQGYWDVARDHLVSALKTARATTNPLLEAEVLEELAVLEQSEGRDDEAEKLIAQCVGVYQQIGSPARAQRARERLAHAGVSGPVSQNNPEV